ncbi:MAG: hypothetical protein DI620_02015 [Haemophilus parainfluenzae]|nr:MAG: hypothetical protein DI620_02015 [Haemophilus parainfluenzae]
MKKQLLALVFLMFTANAYSNASWLKEQVHKLKGEGHETVDRIKVSGAAATKEKLTHELDKHCLRVGEYYFCPPINPNWIEDALLK